MEGMNLTQILIALLTVIFSGGIAGFLKVRSDAKVRETEARIEEELSNLRGCMSLLEQSKHRVEELEQQNKDLRLQLIEELKQRREEDKAYIKQVEGMRADLEIVKAELEHERKARKKLELELVKYQNDSNNANDAGSD